MYEVVSTTVNSTTHCRRVCLANGINCTRDVRTPRGFLERRACHTDQPRQKQIGSNKLGKIIGIAWHPAMRRTRTRIHSFFPRIQPKETLRRSFDFVVCGQLTLYLRWDPKGAPASAGLRKQLSYVDTQRV